ncbi:MAG: hypothetical protein Q9169_008500 [Polycauliona sp. 2 TL-2023]
MDPVFYKANLTAIARLLLAQNGDEFEGTIELIDRDFPRPFAEQFVDKTKLDDAADGSALLKETFNVALELRTRTFIDNAKRLIDMPNFDPDSILQQVFYKDGGNTLAGWDVQGLQSQDLLKSPELRNTIITHLIQLRKAFSVTESPFIDIGSLERSFPQSRILAHLGLWSQLRLDEIKSQLKRLKGAKGIADAVQGALDLDSTSDKSRPHNGQMEEVARSVVSGQSLRSLNAREVFQTNIGRLKAREATRRASKNQEQALRQATAAVVATPTPITAGPPLPPASAPARVPIQHAPLSRESPGWLPADIESGEELNNERENTSVVERIMQTQETLNAESNKENFAVQTRSKPTPSSQRGSRREAATQRRSFPRRIAFESQEPESSVASNGRHMSSHQSREEARGSQSDISEDEGFQLDTRSGPRWGNPNTAPRRAITGAERQRPPKRARTGRERRETVADDDVGVAVQRHNAADPPPVASQAEIYRLANSRAKERVALQPKRMQVRKAWSSEEIDRLTDLITEYGTSWTLLKDLDKSQGGVLRHRDQVALKDKARNIKSDLLK